jgi:uncharacterized protein (DUF885 family)
VLSDIDDALTMPPSELASGDTQMYRHASFALLLAASWLTAASAAPSPSKTPANDPQGTRVTKIADAYVAEFVKRFPESATFSGLQLERHDTLSDNSRAALREWETMEDRWAAEIATIDSAKLHGTPDWLVLGFLREALESSRQMRVCRYELWPANQMSGWQVTVAQLAAIQPVGTEAARREALARWRQLPRYLNNEIDNMRDGLRNGYSTPKRNVELVIEQLEQLLSQPVEQSPLFAPAARDESAVFRQQWTELLTTEIKPSIQRYRDYLQNEYLAKAREPIAITANRDGEKCYQGSFRSYTTIDRPARETFELGRKVVERNLKDALVIGRERLSANDLTALRERLNEDPANHFESRDELLQFAEATVARAKVQMPKWFSRVPRADLIVQAYPDFLERTASDSYWPAAQDGSRPAMYRITLYRHEQITRSNAEITAVHEGYPGHHLQLGLATERPSAHLITRLVGNSGFAEGWARYAEALAEEMGLYTSDYARANRRLWPARGMVIDPGIHLFGWTREQAMAFAIESGRFHEQDANAMVDRVAMWPGQLTAYDTGALEFFALREQAQKALGSKFDPLEFHAVLLENGTMTLPMLREHVNHWLRTKR